MKHKILSTTGWLVMAAALTTGMTACSSEDIIVDSTLTGEQTFTMTISASKSSDAMTRALALDQSSTPNTLSATWAAGERVTVHNDTRNADLGGYLEAQSNGETTTLSGTLTGTVLAGDNLTLKFLSPDDYTSQDGTLDYIASHCDYATATVTVASVAGGVITTTSTATFTNQQAIVRFTLYDKLGNKLYVEDLKVNDGSRTYTLTKDEWGDENNTWYRYFAAIPGISGGTIGLTATATNWDYSPSTFTYEKSGVTFVNGKFYDIAVKMANQTAVTIVDIDNNPVAPTGINYNLPEGISWVYGTGSANITGSGSTSLYLFDRGIIINGCLTLQSVDYNDQALISLNSNVVISNPGANALVGSDTYTTEIDGCECTLTIDGNVSGKFTLTHGIYGGQLGTTLRVKGTVSGTIYDEGGTALDYVTDGDYKVYYGGDGFDDPGNEPGGGEGGEPGGGEPGGGEPGGEQ